MWVKFVRDTMLDEVMHPKGEIKEYSDPIARKLIDTTSVVEAEREEIPAPKDEKKKAVK